MLWGNERQDWVQRARAVPIETEIERRGIKLRHAGAERVGPCPKCGGDDRFSINIKKQVFNCRGCALGGDVISLVQFLDSADFNAAAATLAGPPPKKPNGKGHVSQAQEIVVAEFAYHDESGNVLSVVERREYRQPDGNFVINRNGKHKKSFKQKRPDPDRPGNWLWNVDGVRVVPYALPEVIEAIAAHHPVLVVEGETKVDLLRSWNIAATCCAGGAKKWRPEHSRYLRAADVVLLPDNDNAGWEHVHNVGAALVGVAKRIRVLMLPVARAKDDIVDWARTGGTREQLDALLADAKDWTPPTETVDQISGDIAREKEQANKREDELLDALTKAQGLDYVRQRKGAAKELGVSSKDIDREVQARRERTTPLYPHWTVEPWPEAVETDSLLRDIISRIRRHVVCTYNDAVAVALWILLSWVHHAATHSPLLVLTSAEPMSGKTTALGVVAFLVPRSIRTVEITEAALYRSIEIWRPTFVIDEFDCVLANDEKAALRSVINSGHVRGDGVLRVNKDKGNTPEIFPTFCPKAIGMVGRKLPPATLTRCIFIELKRRKREEQIEKFKFDDDKNLSDLRHRLLRWSVDNLDRLCGAKPSIPTELENRYDDNWRLQFAIADLAGEDWAEQARITAIELEGAADNTTARARLLVATKKILSEVDGDIGSHQLIDRLVADPDSEWAEWQRGKPITQAQLARLLKPFHIFPDQIWIGGHQLRGYRRSQFEDAWSRYL